MTTVRKLTWFKSNWSPSSYSVQNITLETFMKLGFAVEIKPSVLIEQFTNWERMSQAASADSVLLSTYQ